MPDQDKGQSGDKSQDQSKFKIKVQGQEKEVSLDELKELAQKGDDYTIKTQQLAEKEKTLKALEEEVKGVKVIVDEMKTNPKLGEALNKVYTDFKSGKISESDDVKDKSLKTLDKWIKETDDSDQKEKLREMRRVIEEETGVSNLKQELKTLKDEISLLRATTVVNQSERIENQLEGLEVEYGKDLVDKYKAEIKSSAIKYPHTSIEKLLFHFATKDELTTALLASGEKKKKEELERKKKGASQSGSDTVTTPLEVKRDKHGRFNWPSLKADIKEKYHL